jgi:hypothetical protein
MASSVNSVRSGKQSWTYATLTVLDGSRQLKPCEVAFDRMHFAAPPRLTSNQVEIVLVNGDEEQRHFATVLPHDANATRIPIRLNTGPENS